MKNRQIRDIRSILIVDDHPLYADALSLSLRTHLPAAGIRVVAGIADALAAILAADAPFDLVILDLNLPDSDGDEGFHRLSRHVAADAIFVVSGGADDRTVRRLLEAGAAGFMPKSACAGMLRTVIDQIRHGLPFRSTIAPDRATGRDTASVARRLARLTPQQARILDLIRAGKQNKQIAYEMNLAEATIKAHITALLRRLEVGNRTQAALLAEAIQGGTGTGMAAE